MAESNEKTKVCTKCGEEKLLSDFGNDRKLIHGKKNRCKTCDKEYARLYYLNNSQSISNKAKSWRQNHLKKSREYSRKYRNKNKKEPKPIKGSTSEDETVRKAYRKKYFDENPEKVAANITRIKNNPSYKNNQTYYKKLAISQGYSEQLIDSNPVIIEVIKKQIKAKRYVKSANKKGDKHE